ncbi:MAG: fibronectin type III domain-containing protein [Clostridia bacterium]|nr:fibronectin type III domain-containing protein [Clostridia bacterium]
MKRCISLVMVFLLLVCSMPAAVYANPDGEQIEPTSPSIEKFTAVANGVKIEITPFEGAAGYRLFLWKDDKWKTLGDTQTTSFTHKDLQNNTVYTYTVRALNAVGELCSDYDQTGWSWRFHTHPVISEVRSAYYGMKIMWNPVAGVSRYRVYVKEGSTWKGIANVKDCKYFDTSVVSSKSYTYTVRCLAEDEKTLVSFYDTKGKSATYIAAPKVTSIENLAKGSKLTWAASKGASIYRVFVKDGNTWKKLANVKGLSYTHTPLKNQQEFVYTIRVVDSKGQFISSYDNRGWSNRFLIPPTISSVKKVDAGVKVSWKAVSNVKQYRVYRKKYGEKWQGLANVAGTSYVDTASPTDFPYTYTVRCLAEDSALASWYVTYSQYFVGTSLAKGTFAVGSQSLYFENGTLYTGYRTTGGKTYYYKAGVLQKNGIVGTKKEGYCYASKSGAVDTSFTGIAKNANGYWYFIKGKLDFTARVAVTYQSKDWNVLNGKAYLVKTEKDKTFFRALKLLAKITTKDMTKEQKLKKCFDHIRSAYKECNPRIPHYHGMDWPIIYANDVFVDGVGNCISFGAALAFLAKAIGYENVYGCHSGGHGWCEIDGLIYDPEWSKHSNKSTYFGLSYDDKVDVNYRGGIGAGVAWMHVKI